VRWESQPLPFVPLTKLMSSPQDVTTRGPKSKPWMGNIGSRSPSCELMPLALRNLLKAHMCRTDW
jgi:hypothetical protein